MPKTKTAPKPKTKAPVLPVKKKRGFNVMGVAQRTHIAQLGGLAVAKARGSAHMAAIGAIGGANSHKGDRGRGNGQ